MWVLLYIDLFYIGFLEYFTQNPRQTSITIKSDNNSVIATYGDIYSGHVDISEISKDLLNAVVSIEDHRFYNHFGVDFRGIVRAIYVNLSEEHVVQGGSTITQQLAKIMFLTALLFIFVVKFFKPVTYLHEEK